jgi:pseudouridine kinase
MLRKIMNGPVTVIGGVNMDINGFSRKPLNMADSNPGRVEYSPGGVGRNIAENLRRLGAEARFIGVLGDDPGGELVRSSAAHIGLNIGHSLFLENRVTPVYIALMDSNGEMKVALSDMDIMEEMTEAHLESKAGIISESRIVLLDTNLTEGIINFVLDRFGGGAGPLFFLDAVSARKAPRAASRLGSFDTLKLGRMEASALSSIEIPDFKSSDEAAASKLQALLKEASGYFINRGARRVFITLGKAGVYYASVGKSFFRPVRYAPPVNTTGAGDAFMAGIVYGTLRGWGEERIVSFSSAMAGITVRSKSAVSPDMSLELAEANE